MIGIVFFFKKGIEPYLYTGLICFIKFVYIYGPTSFS